MSSIAPIDNCYAFPPLTIDPSFSPPVSCNNVSIAWNTTATFGEGGGVTNCYRTPVATVTTTQVGSTTTTQTLMTMPPKQAGCYPPVRSLCGNAVLEYSGIECPSGFDALSTAISAAATSRYCCPTEPGANWMAFPGGVSSSTIMCGGAVSPSLYYGVQAITLLDYGSGITPSATVGSTQASTTPAQTSSRAVATPSSSSAPAGFGGSSGLGGGAKAGIGVGAALGGILLIVAIALVYWRRKRSPNQEKENASNWNKAELHGDTVESHKHANEVGSVAVHEVDGKLAVPEVGSRTFHELDDTSRPVEAPGDHGR